MIFKTTPITMLAGADNPMVEGLSTSWSYVDNAAAVPAAVAAAVAGMASSSTPTPARPTWRR